MAKIMSIEERASALMDVVSNSVALAQGMKKAAEIDVPGFNEELKSALRITFQSLGIMASSIGAIATQMMDDLQDSVPDKKDSQTEKNVGGVGDREKVFHTEAHRDIILMKAKKVSKKKKKQ